MHGLKAPYAITLFKKGVGLFLRDYGISIDGCKNFKACHLCSLSCLKFLRKISTLQFVSPEHLVTTHRGLITSLLCSGIFSLHHSQRAGVNLQCTKCSSSPPLHKVSPQPAFGQVTVVYLQT